MIENKDRLFKRNDAKSDQLTQKVYRALGGLTALSTAAIVGIVEARFRNKDKTPLSLGPIPAQLLAGTGLQITAFFVNPLGQVSSAADGCLGAYGATLGRGWGNAWRTKASTAGKVSGDWDDQLEEAMVAEESALLDALD